MEHQTFSKFRETRNTYKSLRHFSLSISLKGNASSSPLHVSRSFSVRGIPASHVYCHALQLTSNGTNGVHLPRISNDRVSTYSSKRTSFLRILLHTCGLLFLTIGLSTYSSNSTSEETVAVFCYGRVSLYFSRSVFPRVLLSLLTSHYQNSDRLAISNRLADHQSQ